MDEERRKLSPINPSGVIEYGKDGPKYRHPIYPSSSKVGQVRLIKGTLEGVKEFNPPLNVKTWNLNSNESTSKKRNVKNSKSDIDPFQVIDPNTNPADIIDINAYRYSDESLIYLDELKKQRDKERRKELVSNLAIYGAGVALIMVALLLAKGSNIPGRPVDTPQTIESEAVMSPHELDDLINQPSPFRPTSTVTEEERMDAIRRFEEQNPIYREQREFENQLIEQENDPVRGR